MEFGIALGSNEGDRLRFLKDAAQAIESLAIDGTPLVKSAAFATTPVDCPTGAEDFLNAVVIVQSNLEPLAMLDFALTAETSAGRVDARNRPRNAPRPLDIDLLYAGEIQMDTARMTLPHPRLHLRRFVLEPLASVRPHLILPGFSSSVAQVLATLQSDEPPLKCAATDW